jgi:hypothetical protein
MIRAAVYVGPAIPDDERLAVEGYEFVKNRGYEYVGAYRQWHYVEQLLQAGIATMVVFARGAQRPPDCDWPAEFVDDAAQPIRHLPPRIDQDKRERYGTTYSAPRCVADDAPTVAILDRWRDRDKQPNARKLPPRDDGGFADRFLRNLLRSRHMGDT